ncbi:MAG: hypothetical protein N3B21_13935 [Clostridia bacterium]|nr:hypothetical protein [Clostridia bacterium]
MDHMGGMGSTDGYGTSLDAFLGGMLLLLVKFLMVVLVIAVIIGAGVWIKKTFFKNANTNQLFQAVKSDPILKTVSVITLGVIGVIFLLALLGGLTGTGMGMGGGMTSHGSMLGGFSTALSISGLLTLLIRILSFVLVISLILALAAYLKKQYDQGAFNFTGGNAQAGQSGANAQPDTQPEDSNNNG